MATASAEKWAQRAILILTNTHLDNNVFSMNVRLNRVTYHGDLTSVTEYLTTN